MHTSSESSLGHSTRLRSVEWKAYFGMAVGAAKATRRGLEFYREPARRCWVAAVRLLQHNEQGRYPRVVATQRTSLTNHRDPDNDGRWRTRARGQLQPALTRVLRPYEAGRARRLARSGVPIRLHLGCGPFYKEGWINVDLARPGRKLDVAWDLRWGLPFENGSVDAIFSEHLLEHLTWTDGLQLFRRCFAALRGGARMRVGVPDLGRYIASYVGSDPLIEACRPGRPTPAMALNELYYCHGHHYMYDAETLIAFLAEVGFVQVEVSSFGGGALGKADTPSRAAETLYVEAVRPAGVRG